MLSPRAWVAVSAPERHCLAWSKDLAVTRKVEYALHPHRTR